MSNKVISNKVMKNKNFRMRKVAALTLALGLGVITPVLGAEEKEGFTSSISFDQEELELGFVAKVKEAETETETEKEEVAESEEDVTFVSSYDGPVLNPASGTVMGPSGKETYYNLDMSGVIQIMRGMGNTDEYWVREDGVKMLGKYIMCAANLDVHPRGSLVESSLGTCIVCDTGGFAYENAYQLDIAVTW